MHLLIFIIEHFVAGSTARAAPEIVGVETNTAIRLYMRLRHLIASKQPSYDLSGEVEADESYFAGVCKGKRRRGAGGKSVYLAFSSGTVRFTQPLFPMPEPRHCCQSFRER